MVDSVGVCKGLEANDYIRDYKNKNWRYEFGYESKSLFPECIRMAYLGGYDYSNDGANYYGPNPYLTYIWQKSRDYNKYCSNNTTNPVSYTDPYDPDIPITAYCISVSDYKYGLTAYPSSAKQILPSQIPFYTEPGQIYTFYYGYGKDSIYSWVRIYAIYMKQTFIGTGKSIDPFALFPQNGSYSIFAPNWFCPSTTDSQASCPTLNLYYTKEAPPTLAPTLAPISPDSSQSSSGVGQSMQNLDFFNDITQPKQIIACVLIALIIILIIVLIFLIMKKYRVKR